MLMILVFIKQKILTFNKKINREKIYYLYKSSILLTMLDYMPELFTEEFDTSLLVGKSVRTRRYIPFLSK